MHSVSVLLALASALPGCSGIAVRPALPSVKKFLRSAASAGLAFSLVAPPVPLHLAEEVYAATRTLPEVTLDTLQKNEKTLVSLFEERTVSVAYINTYVQTRDTFSMNVMEVPAGTGSGIVWDKEGHVVTNFHVIRSAQSAQVVLTEPDGDKKTYVAKLSGYDADKDIAVLKVDAPQSNLYPIELGSSANLKVGQSTLAIGSPFGLDHSLTTGIVSGLGREMRSPTGRPISNVIQTDAAINPGNSGGPLLNSKGQLIGMNTAIYSPSGASAGIGFAIPVDTLKAIVETIIKYGRVIRPIIGITYLESSQARALGIDSGVLVLDVPEGSAAAEAGIKGTSRDDSGYINLGDIIIEVGDEKVRNEGDLFKALERYQPGDKVKIAVVRLPPGTSQRSAYKNEEALEEFVSRVTVELQSSESLEGKVSQPALSRLMR